MPELTSLLTLTPVRGLRIWALLTNIYLEIAVLKRPQTGGWSHEETRGVNVSL
jgi:hypothetical protein